MVTSTESFLCCVLNEATEDHWAFLLGTESTVQDLYDQVASRCERNEYSFKLRCDEQGSLIPNSINLHNKKAKKLKDVGFQPLVKNQITLAMKEAKEVVREDVGSACSDAPLSPPPDPPPPPPTSAPSSSNLPALTYDEPSSSVPVPFVGLVNQAMTCYLNSLLQALFMTPEFRNALYHWKYDGSQGSELPLELQKLFLKLQTSKRQSVETTALTKSFGWNSSEAWTQHDIQELCRLLFDALERQFKGTDQADLINRLYEGTMLDYVRCLECSTERHREDKFLDIPLPVRPFGSTAAYNSVEEALRAFVQPETLEGNNQYHCEKCNKKCDAHKGLKFTHFPYLLTLHLKRFDFDYNTFNRIKLNDKVTFPYTLNLNGFVKKTNGEGAGDTAEETVKYDDCSTTDSGSALDEDNADASAPAPVPQPIHTNHVDIQEEDEGIDVSNTAESEKNRANACEPGPYMYDLFSIMIHSGSASGGHYYAYIKDYTTGGWFCFNDHSVSRIKEEDIERTYGGGSRYSSLCYSSTNAYMLMYRQIDPKRNVTAMSEDQFPPHLHEQLKVIEEQKAIQQRIQQSERDMMRIKCYYKSPEDEKVKMYRLSFHKNTPLRSALIEARQSAGVDDSVPTEQCRLVSYDSVKQLIECSFEGRENDTVSDLSIDCYKDRDWLLQVRAPEEVFTVHRFGDITTRIMVIDPTSRDLDGSFIVATNENSDLRKFREQVASVLRFDPASTQLFSTTYSLEVEALTDDFKTLKELRVINKERIYVYNGPVTNPLSIDQAVLNALNIINLHINLPLVTEEILQELNIPGGLPEECAAARAPSPQVLPDVGVESTFPTTNEDLLTGAYSDQSASEDSSLTDSERTIIGDAPSSPDNMSPQVSPLFGRRAPSPNETFSYGSMALDRISRHVDSDEENDCHFFKVKSSPDPKAPFPRVLEVLVDKRMCMTEIKKQLERHVGVRTDYFKMFLQVSGSETEMSRTEHPLKTAHDDAVINVRLGRAPRKGELSGKVYLLDLNKDEPEKYLFDWLIAEGAAVSAVKKEMLDEARRRSGLDIPYNRCRLRQKKYKIPEQPYIDSSHIKDIQTNWEMYIQELDGDEPMSDPVEQRLVFARQWCPSTTELKPFSEFLLTSDTVSELGQKISDKCGIPVEKIQIAYGTVSFPCKLTPRDIHSDLVWKSVSQDSGANKLKIYPFHPRDNSGVVFFRDSREEFKAPSHEILKDQASDDWRKKPTYQRREKALRICAEVPKKDSDVE